MTFPQRSADVDACMQLFSMRQKGQLDVFGLWGVLQGQLLTDDSFVYNRVLSRVKASIQHLPEATEEDDEALLRVKVPFFMLATCCTYTILDTALDH